MDSHKDVVLSPAPRSASSVGSRRASKFFLPLSNHGMPKTPHATAQGGSLRSHRFLTSPPSLRSSSLSSAPTSPAPLVLKSPVPPMSPMSPPTSAKSYATFIDSEPSTPAYSPRVGSSQWDGTTLVVLSPAPPTSASPLEPEWDLLSQGQSLSMSIDGDKGSQQPKLSPRLSREISPGTSLSSHPFKVTEKAKSVDGEGEGQKKRAIPAAREEKEEGEDEEERRGGADVDQDGDGMESKEKRPVQTRPARKLAKIKSMLHRRTPSDKKVEKRRRDSYELHRMETVHWTDL